MKRHPPQKPRIALVCVLAVASLASAIGCRQAPPPAPASVASPLERAFARRDAMLAHPGTDVTVRPGDTLNEIARRYGSTASAVAAANAMKVSDPIHPGDILFVPLNRRR